MNNKCIVSGQMRRYGFVEMASKSEAKVAIKKLNGKVYRGKVINVIEALPLSAKNIRSNRIFVSVKT
jgi:RNA recognition motif-containing protein